MEQLIKREGADYSVRYIHLTKIARMNGVKPQDIDNNLRVERSFNVMGFYDTLTYVRPKELYTNYKHGFNIVYPYSEIKDTDIISEQFFSLYDLAYDENFDTDSDPFEYVHKNKSNVSMPFLGILLVSCEMPTAADGKKLEKSYEEMLRDIIDCIQKYPDFKGDEYKKNNILKVYLTLNCANVAVVLRTNNLQNIYRLRSYISTCKIKLDESRYIIPECSFTSFTCCEIPKWENGVWYNPLDEQIIEQQNSFTYVNMRISLCTSEFFDQYCGRDGSNDQLFQILGDGTFSVTLPLKKKNLESGHLTYAELYPWICDMKYKIVPSSEAENFNPGDQNLEFKDYLLKEFRCNNNKGRHNIRNVHERLRFKKMAWVGETMPADSNSQEYSIYLMNESTDLKNCIEQYIDTLYQYRNLMGNYSKMYERNLILMKDLCYTFGDLCQLKKFAVHGHIFIIQMKILCDNIKSFGDRAIKYQSVMDEDAAKYVCDCMKQAILAINNYSKMLQSFTQDSINNQIYEIQTKVNSEKYILAYTDFILQIFNMYHNQYAGMQTEEERRINIFPMVFLDINQNIILTKLLFDKEDTNCHLFTVNFPDYRNFGNIYHVLPVIVHEVSHYMRYQNHAERNDNVLDFVFEKLGKEIAKYLTLAAADKSYYTRNRFNELLAPVIQNHLLLRYKKAYDSEDTKYKSMHMQGLQVSVTEWLENYLPDRTMSLNHILDWSEWYPAFCSDIKKLYQFMGAEFYGCNDVKEIAGRIKILDVQEKPEQAEMLISDFLCSITVRLMMYDKKMSGLAEIMQEFSSYINFLEEIKDHYNKYEPYQSGHGEDYEFYYFIDRILSLIEKIPKENDIHSYPELLSELLVLYTSFEMNPVFQLPDRVIGNYFLKKCLDKVKTEIEEENLQIEELSLILKFISEPENASWLLSSSADFDEGIKRLWEQCEHKDSIVIQYFQELLGLCDIETSIFQISRVRKNYEYVSNENVRISNLRKDLYKCIKDVYTKKNNDLDILRIGSPANNLAFNQLGINLIKDEGVFSDNFKRMSNAYGDVLIGNAKVYFKLYEEIYSDLGMCAAFGFNEKGYLRLLYSVHDTDKDTSIQENNFLSDRAFYVLAVLIMREIFNQDSATYNQYFESKGNEDIDNIVKNRVLRKLGSLIEIFTGDIEKIFDSVKRNKTFIADNLKNMSEKLSSDENTKEVIADFLALGESTDLIRDYFDEFNSIEKAIVYGDIGRYQWMQRLDSILDYNVQNILYFKDKFETVLGRSIIIEDHFSIDNQERTSDSVAFKLYLDEFYYYLRQLQIVYNEIVLVWKAYKVAFSDIHEFVRDYLKDIIDCFQGTICASQWVNYIRNDQAIQGISQYYNDKENVCDDQKARYDARLNENYYRQLFIHKHYCELRDKMGSFGYTENDQIMHDSHNSDKLYNVTLNCVDAWIENLLNH